MTQQIRNLASCSTHLSHYPTAFQVAVLPILKLDPFSIEFIDETENMKIKICQIHKITRNSSELHVENVGKSRNYAILTLNLSFLT